MIVRLLIKVVFFLSNIATVVNYCALLIGDDMVNLWQAADEHVCTLLKETWKMACEKALKKYNKFFKRWTYVGNTKEKNLLIQNVSEKWKNGSNSKSVG